MTWVEVTPAQLAEAEQWWESRTLEERQRDWPIQSYMQLRTMAGCWRSWDYRSRYSFAATLINAGLICQPRKPAVSIQPEKKAEVR